MPFDFWKHYKEEDLANEIIWNITDVLEYGCTLERRALVTCLPKLGKVEIFSDHNPPHFHIKGENVDYKFTIETLEQIKGDTINSKQKKNLEKWYFQNNGKNKLLLLWNQRNPDKEVELCI